MDNSLIPRAFSPTDAKRRAEENARDAERRSSARNTSSATIPDGGVLTLAGGIEVVDGGTVDVVGQGFDNGGNPYEIRGRVTSIDSVGNYGVYSSPGLVFSSAIFGENAAMVYSRDGRGVTVQGSQPGVGLTTMIASQTGGNVTFSDSSPAYGNATGKYREASSYVGSTGFELRFHDDAVNSASAIVADGNGNIDIQTTGALTQNGAPISGGGGAVSSVAGKTGAVTLVKADVGLDQVDNTSDLAKPVSTATQTALNGKVNTGPQHAEFTLTASVPTGGPLAAYTVSFTADAANTTGTAFATTPAAGKIGLPAGTYAVHHYSDCGASMGTGAVLAIQNDAMTKRFSSLDVVSGSYNGGVNHPCIYLPTAQNLTFSIAQFSGVTRTANVRIYLEKIK